MEPVQLLRRLGSVPRLIPLLLDVPNKDRISMIRLPGGGGLLSYCKEGSVYVHTFNTESGLIRKVDALGLTNWRCILDPEPAGSCAEACSACVAVLPFLLDAEKHWRHLFSDLVEKAMEPLHFAAAAMHQGDDV